MYVQELLIKPAKDSKLAVLRKIKGILDSNKSASPSMVIRLLNPIIRGWGNYYSTQVSKKVFAYCDHRINQMLWRWAKRRHPKKSAWWYTRGTSPDAETDIGYSRTVDTTWLS